MFGFCITFLKKLSEVVEYWGAERHEVLDNCMVQLLINHPPVSEKPYSRAREIISLIIHIPASDYR